MRLPALLALAAGSVLSFSTLPALAQPAAPAANTAEARAGAPVADLPIRRITLYRSGVASFERRGIVSGDADVQLRFRTEQVNDILKSMVVLDLSRGKGRVDAVSYASREPLARRLASFGIDLSDEPPIGTILARLRGSGVAFTTPEGAITGTIVGGETRPQAMGNAQHPVNVPFVHVLTDAGIRSVSLYDMRSVRLTDPALAEELAKALAALAEHRADRSKAVDIALSGDGQREIVVAYVQEAPVWKASYRLVLPDNPSSGPGDSAPAAEKVTLQGWAIVENTTDDDWRNVTLSLVSGRPVSFRMDLYEPLFLDRPELPVPTEPGALARSYEGGIFLGRDAIAKDADAAGESMRRSARGAGGVSAPASPAPGRPMPAMEMRALTAEMMSDAIGQGVGRAVETGEVFQFEIQHPVTVERQRSAMLPLTSALIDAKRVSIFNPSDNARHPMRGVRITNATGAPLMPGPVAVYDAGAYAGDATISHVPAGDSRLLAYSVDLDVAADAAPRATQELLRFRIANGLLESSTTVTNATTYTMTNKDATRPRTILIEHPRMDGWELVNTPAPVETTSTATRFEMNVPAGKPATFTVTYRRVERQSFELVSYDVTRLAAFARQGKVSDAVLAAVREAGRRQGEINTLTQRVAALDRERREIADDQARVRQNLSAVDRASDLHARYMKRLADQESRLDAIATETAAARADLDKAQRDLAAYVASLNVE
jgi:hypothetical protein